MFYVKHSLCVESDATIKVPLTNATIVTHCPRCGVEHDVDLNMLIIDDEIDLENSQVYCKACSSRRDHCSGGKEVSIR